jgi:transcriptional regulator with XRE-family HTH domain
MNQKDVAARLDEVGRPMLPTVVSKIERGDRRIDVDDLVALALALNVSPLTLLMPDAWELDDDCYLTETYRIPSRTAWLWAEGYLPPERVEALTSDDPDETRRWAERAQQYRALVWPADRRIDADHPASKATASLSEAVGRLILAAKQRSSMTRMLRLARIRLGQVANELDQIELENEELDGLERELEERRKGAPDE